MAGERIAYLGMGTWGYCLASMLAKKGHSVKGWTPQRVLIQHIESHGEHPRFLGYKKPPLLSLSDDMAWVLDGSDVVVEAVTSAGLRPVFQKVKSFWRHPRLVVVTSKGIEQDSGKILPDVVAELLGVDEIPFVSALSGPSFAEEVMRELPTSVVAAAYNHTALLKVCELFSGPYFRVYPNEDVVGVAYGGALKNIIAIACGIAEGLALGYGCAAALMTRGLHEIRKLALARGAQAETLNGLSGMGDLCMTCSTPLSRNFRFGLLLARGASLEQAYADVGAVVEGAYSCKSALQLGRQHNVPLPITETVYKIVYERLAPLLAVDMLMQRTVKLEHL